MAARPNITAIRRYLLPVSHCQPAVWLQEQPDVGIDISIDEEGLEVGSPGPHPGGLD